MEMQRDWDHLAVYKQPPEVLRSKLQIPLKTLMSPGPTNCSERVLQSFQNQVINHLHPEFCQLMDEIKAGLQYVFQTKNRLTLALSASGHGGMEACLVNLLEPGDTVLIVKCGIWGERAAEMSNRIGANVRLLETDLNVGITLEQLKTALEEHKPDVVFMVHAETSTGVKQPLQGYGTLVRRYNALLLVDAVASVGGEPFFMDSWDVDAVYAASQKGLGGPPGLAPVSFNSRAEQKLFRRKTKPLSFYWDLNILGVYWKCFGNKDRCYHHTMSATLIYGLREALAELAEKGLQECWARNVVSAARLRKGLELRGLRLFVQLPQYQLSTVVSVDVPPGIDDKIVSQRAMEKYQVEVARGLGPTMGKVFRIGLLGINATPEKVDLFLRALDEGLKYATASRL